MRKLIFFIGLIFLSSCYKYFDTDTKTTTGILIGKEYKPAHSEYCYHYGYNFMSGKFNWHWGMDEKSESYSVSFVCLNDTMTYGSVELYKNLPDTFSVVYVDSYLIKNNDSTFRGHIIQKIVINDTLSITIYQ